MKLAPRIVAQWMSTGARPWRAQPLKLSARSSASAMRLTLIGMPSAFGLRAQIEPAPAQVPAGQDHTALGIDVGSHGKSDPGDPPGRNARALDQCADRLTGLGDRGGAIADVVEGRIHPGHVLTVQIGQDDFLRERADRDTDHVRATRVQVKGAGRASAARVGGRDGRLQVA
ncbi:MAG: hypothetical protein R3E68_13565 [Burkholderiaceae bacterium]